MEGTRERRAGLGRNAGSQARDPAALHVHLQGHQLRVVVPWHEVRPDHLVDAVGGAAVVVLVVVVVGAAVGDVVGVLVPREAQVLVDDEAVGHVAREVVGDPVPRVVEGHGSRDGEGHLRGGRGRG